MAPKKPHSGTPNLSIDGGKVLDDPSIDNGKGSIPPGSTVPVGTISEIPPESAKAGEAGNPASLSQADVTETLAATLLVTGFPSLEILTNMAKIGRDVVVLIDSYRVEGAPTIFYPAMAEAPTEVVADLFETIVSLRESILKVGETFAVTISPSSTDHDREKLLQAFDAIGVDVRALSFLPTTPIAWASELDGDTGPSFAEQLAELTEGKGLSGFAEQFPLTVAAMAAFQAINEPGVLPTEIRITSEREAFRRAGIVHSRAARDYPAGTLSPDQVEILLADPILTVEFLNQGE